MIIIIIIFRTGKNASFIAVVSRVRTALTMTLGISGTCYTMLIHRFHVRVLFARRRFFFFFFLLLVIRFSALQFRELFFEMIFSGNKLHCNAATLSSYNVNIVCLLGT